MMRDVDVLYADNTDKNKDKQRWVSVPVHQQVYSKRWPYARQR